MSRSRFLYWLKRYGEAVRELSWVGSEPTCEERMENEKYYKALLNHSRTKLLEAAKL